VALAEKSFEYRGDLSERTLPEMLFAIDRFQVAGVIEASRNGVVKRIFVQGGNVIHASSTDLRDSLGCHLERTGRLDREQSTRMMQMRRNSPQRLGVLLIETGLLSPGDVYGAIREQVEEIVWSLFAWQEGQVTFKIGDYRDSGMVRIQLPMRQVILEGIKRATDAKPLVARLGDRETVFEADYRTESLIEIALTEKDLELLDLADGRRTLYEISTEGPYSLRDNAKLMYAFHVMQLIREVPAETRAEEARPAASNTQAIKIRFQTQQPS
jgi:hypothetical protein